MAEEDRTLTFGAATPFRLRTPLWDIEDPFRSIVEGVQDYAIFMLDPQGHISSWNLGAQRIKGCRENEILGKHFSLFYLEGDRRARKPERELEFAAKEGRLEDEGWRVRKDASMFCRPSSLPSRTTPD